MRTQTEEGRGSEVAVSVLSALTVAAHAMRFPARDSVRSCGMSATARASAAGSGCCGALMSIPDRSSTRSDTPRTSPANTPTNPIAGKALEQRWSCVNVEEASLDSQCSRLDV